jgi:hypothetical protein
MCPISRRTHVWAARQSLRELASPRWQKVRGVAYSSAAALNSEGKISADTALTGFFLTIPQERENRTHLLETEFCCWPSLKSEPLLRFRRKRESRGIYDEF